MKLYRNVLAFATLGLIATAGAGHAHERNYVATTPYSTTPKGQLEIEMSNDFDKSSTDEDVYIHQTEIEYGATNRLTLGMYGVYEKAGSRPFEYAKTKFEGIYRLAESGRLPVDPALYMEYKLGANDRADGVEAKLVLSRDFGRNGDMNVTFNGVLEKDRESGSKCEKEYVLGFSKMFSEKASAGVEFEAGGGEAYVIPGAYVSLGAGKRLNIGTAVGLTGKSDDFQIKTILELELF